MKSTSHTRNLSMGHSEQSDEVPWHEVLMALSRLQSGQHLLYKHLPTRQLIAVWKGHCSHIAVNSLTVPYGGLPCWCTRARKFCALRCIMATATSDLIPVEFKFVYNGFVHLSLRCIPVALAQPFCFSVLDSARPHIPDIRSHIACYQSIHLDRYVP